MSDSQPPWGRGDRIALGGLLFTVVVALICALAAFFRAESAINTNARDTTKLEEKLDKVSESVKQIRESKEFDRAIVDVKLQLTALQKDVDFIRGEVARRRR